MSAKILYWLMVTFSLATLALGVWAGFFFEKHCAVRVARTRVRIGEKPTQILLSTLRILSLLVAVLSGYLLFGLGSIVQCALR